MNEGSVISAPSERHVDDKASKDGNANSRRMGSSSSFGRVPISGIAEIGLIGRAVNMVAVVSMASRGFGQLRVEVSIMYLTRLILKLMVHLHVRSHEHPGSEVFE